MWGAFKLRPIAARAARWIGVMAAVSVSAVLAAAPGASAATWSPLAPPVPNAGNGQLAATSCVSSTSCVAVGYYVTALGQQRGLIETWNGSTWTQSSAMAPSGSVQSFLSGVSCTGTSPTTCVVVGSYATAPGGKLPFTEYFNGTSWVTHAVPLPAGTSLADLNAVFCGTATSCWAVGAYDNGTVDSGTLTERWNGTAWTRFASPNPAGATDTTLNGVSCRGTICMAVGDFATSAGSPPSQPMAEEHTSSGWQLVTMPAPSGTSGAWLTGVSCTSTTGCMAAGGYTTSGSYPDKMLAEQWNGSSWAVLPTPAEPPNAPQAFFSSVSCRTATSCLAVGGPNYWGSGTVPLAATWNGTAWAIATPINPTNRDSWLWGASCPSSECVAVGGQSFEGPNGSGLAAPLAETMSTTGSWAVQATPEPSGRTNGQFNGATCVTGPSCMVFGFFNDAATPGWLIESWNGTNWTLHSGLLPRAGGAVAGVSCTAASACTAVGYKGNPIVPFGLSWDGTSWKGQSIPPHSAATQTLPLSVSCLSSSSCVAVGYFQQTSNLETLALIEQWNGTVWQVVPAPEPAGVTYSKLGSVSCASGVCLAVGRYSTSSNSLSDQPLAEEWTGTSWVLLSPPTQAGAQYTELTGVSCVTGPACTVVGGDSTTQASYADTAVAMSWNGSAWTVQSPQYPTIGPFSSTSCSSASACQAIGSNSAEGWNGTSWTLEGGLSSGYHMGVGCDPAGNCLAVGANPTAVSVTQANLFAGLSLVSYDVAPLADGLSAAGPSRAAVPMSPPTTSRAGAVRARPPV